MASSPARLAELDELPVLHDRDGLPGELAGGDALHRGPQPVEILEEGPVALRERVEPPGVEAQLLQPVGDQPVVLGLVPDLAGERQLDVDLGRRRQPPGRALGRLDLVLQRDLEEVHDREVALDLGLQRRLGREPLQQLLVLGVQVPDEGFRVHARPSRHGEPAPDALPASTYPRKISGSSPVRVSRVTTRSHRSWRGLVAFQSTWVVQPSTGAGRPAASIAVEGGVHVEAGGREIEHHEARPPRQRGAQVVERARGPERVSEPACRLRDPAREEQVADVGDDADAPASPALIPAPPAPRDPASSGTTPAGGRAT